MQPVASNEMANRSPQDGSRPFVGTRRKVRSHLTQNEALIFEKSSPGKKAYKLPPLDVPEVDAAGAARRRRSRTTWADLPELSEIEIIRHFTRLSTWNYAIDLGMYPLGSCTMKYNPRVNEFVSRLEGIAEAHPYQPESLSQGALRGDSKLLQECLIEITGMDAITLQPAAGAHGEFTGILLARAYHQSQGQSAHEDHHPRLRARHQPRDGGDLRLPGGESASPTRCGMVDVAQLEQLVDEDTAALMLTNPSTIGVFESEIHKIADILHAKGALLYMDGANMNALVGKTRPGDFGVDVMHLNLHKTFSTPHGGGGPGSGPVACKKILEPFLPTPVVRRRRDGRHAAPGLRPAAVGGPGAHVLRQLRHVCARAGLHPGERAGRAAPDDRRRGAERELHPQEAGRPVRPALQDAFACTKWCSATASRRRRA